MERGVRRTWRRAWQFGGHTVLHGARPQSGRRAACVAGGIPPGDGVQRLGRHLDRSARLAVEPAVDPAGGCRVDGTRRTVPATTGSPTVTADATVPDDPVPGLDSDDPFCSRIERVRRIVPGTGTGIECRRRARERGSSRGRRFGRRDAGGRRSRRLVARRGRRRTRHVRRRSPRAVHRARPHGA